SGSFLNFTAEKLSHLPTAWPFLAFKDYLCETGKPFFMKSRLGLLAVPALIAILAVTPATSRAKSDSEQICVSVGRLLEEGHYTHQQLNDDMSRKVLRTYVEILDFSHLFFTQQDIDAITANYGTSLDDAILVGTLKRAYT